MITLDKYFNETKKRLEKAILSLDSREFKKMRNRIRNQLKKKENEFKMLMRSLKVIVLGDCHTPAKRKILNDIKNILLKNAIYTQTIDDYYDVKKKGGLSQFQILQTSSCCELFHDDLGDGLTPFYVPKMLNDTTSQELLP